MRKVFTLLLVFAITGCAGLDLSAFNGLSTFTPPPPNTPEPTITRFPTSSPTPDLFLIYTLGPTNEPPTQGAGSPTLPPPTRTPTATRTLPSTITIPPLDPSLFTPSPQILRNAQRSTSQIVWGSSCDGARSIKFTVDAVTINPKRKVKYVLLFTRLQDKYSGRNTDWQTGAIMLDNDQGRYFYTLELDQIENYMYFEDAWLQYQFVASTAGLTVLGRTIVDQTSVSITHCTFLNSLPPSIHNPFTTVFP